MTRASENSNSSCYKKRSPAFYFVRCSRDGGGAAATDAEDGSSGNNSRGGGKAGRASREWSSLPESALYLVAKGLVASLADLLSFSGVCKGWRSVFTACERELFSSLPPMLFYGGSSLDALGCFYSITEGRSYRRKQRLNWPSRKRAFIAGVSHGYWFVMNCRRQEVFLMDPFVGSSPVRIALPRPPDIMKWPFMTAPPTSPDCVVVSVYLSQIYYCRPGDTEWTCCNLAAGGGDDPDNGRMLFMPRHWTILEGKLYALTSNWKLLIVDLLFPQPSFTVFQIEGLPGKRQVLFSADLVESNGEILYITVKHEDLFFHDETCYDEKHTFAIRRLDIPRRKWVKLSSLGDRTLFLNGNAPSITCDAAKWGGTRDSIYSLCRMSGRLLVFHMKDGSVEHHPIPEGYQSSMWLLPSFCYQ